MMSKQIILAAVLPLSLFLSVSTYAQGGGGIDSSGSAAASFVTSQSSLASTFTSAHQSRNTVMVSGSAALNYGRLLAHASGVSHAAANSNGHFPVGGGRSARTEGPLSTNGLRYTNGPDAIDRSQGRIRADDRQDREERVAQQDRDNYGFGDWVNHGIRDRGNKGLGERDDHGVQLR